MSWYTKWAVDFIRKVTPDDILFHDISTHKLQTNNIIDKETEIGLKESGKSYSTD